MDWLSAHRPVKSIDFYQRKVMLFLHSAEGKDELRLLNIPFTQLGFYSPMQFISCIPIEMCEPYKNDKLFLATAGEIRKGDKVFLLEKESEGVIRSAVFKGKRLGKNNEPEIQLDGHRKTYLPEEVVPYKTYLREHVGTSLIPESNYVISDGVVQWVEPTWEPGEELYYKPEKRWATILNHEANAKGRNVLTIKLDQTKGKREKVTKIMLNDLMADSIPLRKPKRVQGSVMSSASSSDDLILKLQEPETIREMTETFMHPAENEMNVSKYAPRQVEEQQMSVHFEGPDKNYHRISDKNLKDEPQTNKSEPSYVSIASVKQNKDSRTKSGYTSEPEYSVISSPRDKIENKFDYETSKTNGVTPQRPARTKTDKGFTATAMAPFKSILRKKSSKRSVRPVTEYIPEPSSGPTESTEMYQEPEPLKFKSCNNLNVSVPDDDLDNFELVSYTNSLRSSARKLIQKQLAQEATQRSLKATSSTSTRPHVAEVFAWRNYDKPPSNYEVSKITTENKPIIPAVKSNSSNNLSQTANQNWIRKDEFDASRKPYSHASQPSLNMSPLDYNFLPLSSSELVKKQLAAAHRVLDNNKIPSNKNYASTITITEPPEQKGKNCKLSYVACASSDSSSHENDSGRGSFPLLTETPKTSPSGEKDPGPYVKPPPTHSPISSDSAGNGETEDKDTPNRKYARNRWLTKHQIQKHTGEETNYYEDEINIPLPYHPRNLSPVAGQGRGIQGGLNSSYADSTLYALFSCSNIFDRDLLLSKPGQIERGIKKDIRRILCQKIVLPLRISAYCKSENVTHLREAMLPLSSKMHSPLMDAEEFLYLLFDSALNTESFIEFSNGTKDFMHQIVARPKDRSKSQTVQFMLDTSLGIAGLKFKSVPQPALFLCMPRCKGRLVYYEAIIPSLHLNITRLLQQGPKQCVCEMAATLECMLCHQKNGDMALDFCASCKGIADQVHFRLDHSPVLMSKPQQDEFLNLHSIICTRGNRYVAFVKVSEQRLAPWLFFDPMAGEYPEVTLLEDFGKWLDSLEKQPGSYREFAKLHPLLKRIMTDSHIYIYAKTHTIDTLGVESLVI